MKPHVIAYDVGTGSVKAALVHKSGELAAHAERTYPFHQPRPGWFEQDPEDYWQAVVATTREVMSDSGVSPDSILGMVFTTQSMGVIPMDRSGRALRYNITWVDGRAERQAEQIMRMFGGRSVFKHLVGIELTGKDVLGKLVWLRQQEPHIYGATVKILDVNGYLKFRATGRMVFEWSGACAYSFNLKKKDWNRLHFRAIGWDMSKMPELVRSTDRVGSLTAEASEQLRLPRDVVVFGGCDDPQGAAVGAGATRDGDAHVYLGTSAWVAVTTARPRKFAHGAVCLQSADPTHYLVIGITESAGGNLQWLMDRFYRNEKHALDSEGLWQLLDQEASVVPAGSDRLIFTPWLLGERCPFSSTTTRGTLFNLSLEHTRGHFVRALCEGVGFNLRWIIENFQRDFGFSIERLRVIGGASQNEQWLQTIADVTGRELQATERPKTAGAIGAAMCAFVGQGLMTSFQEVDGIVHPRRSFHPRKEVADVYDRCFRDYKSLYYKLRKTYRQANQRRFREDS